MKAIISIILIIKVLNIYLLLYRYIYLLDYREIRLNNTFRRSNELRIAASIVLAKDSSTEH